MKLPDWQTRFEAFIASRQSTPFTWGSNDCGTFAADCVQALTGKEFGAGIRGYQTAQEAAEQLDRHGGVVGIATDALGQPLPASQAQVGDVVLAQSRGQDMLAICNGTTALAPGARGLVSVPFDTICWRTA